MRYQEDDLEHSTSTGAPPFPTPSGKPLMPTLSLLLAGFDCSLSLPSDYPGLLLWIPELGLWAAQSGALTRLLLDQRESVIDRQETDDLQFHGLVMRPDR